jgi:hypothetical protein
MPPERRINLADSLGRQMKTTPCPVSLKIVSDDRRHSDGRSMRQDLFSRCRAAADQMGDDIAGFAIVVWDQRGEMRTSYNTTRGPIGPALVPTLVSDALNRHVAVKLAEERLSDSDGSGN